MTRPTVAHLLPTHNPFPPVYAAGTELRVEQVSRRQQHYRAAIVCAAFPGQQLVEPLDRAVIRRIRIGPVYRRLFQKITKLDPWPYTARMWRVIQEERAVLAHIHNEPGLITGLARDLEKQSLPLVVHVANEKPLPREDLHAVTHWVACSEYIKRWLVEANGIAADKISVIYTGVDVSQRRPAWELTPQARRALRERFGVVERDALVIAFAARIVKEKGLAQLLDAFQLLRAKTQRPLYLLVAGNVRESADPRNEKARYGRAMAERMAREPGVKWVGSLAPSAVHELLVAADVFVLPALWNDPFPTSLVEAAAAGLPILASRRGGITEFLAASPVPCLLDFPQNPTQLSERMLRLLEDETSRHALGHWLHRVAEERFSWERVTREFESLYDRLLGTSRQGTVTACAES